MNTTVTVPTFAEIVATLTAEQDALLVSMDKAIARKNIAKYEVLHARFTELGVAFDALWHHKEAERKAADRKAAEQRVKPAPAAPSATETQGQTFPTFPFADSFEVLADDSAVYLCGQSVARLTSATQGIQTLVALLMQRELDAEVDLTEPCTFGPNVAMGILNAIACCTEVASAAANGRIFPMAVRVQAGSPAHTHMEQAAMQAGRMQRGQE